MEELFIRLVVAFHLENNTKFLKEKLITHSRQKSTGSVKRYVIVMYEFIRTANTTTTEQMAHSL